MKSTKILVFAVMLTALLLLVSACVPKQPPVETPKAVYKPGTYEAVGKGFGGDITVTITVDEYKITDCKIVGEKESAAPGQLAIEAVAPQIVEANGPVDSYSGATYTSEGIFTALEDAMAQAKA